MSRSDKIQNNLSMWMAKLNMLPTDTSNITDTLRKNLAEFMGTLDNATGGLNNIYAALENLGKSTISNGIHDTMIKKTLQNITNTLEFNITPDDYLENIPKIDEIINIKKGKRSSPDELKELTIEEKLEMHKKATKSGPGLSSSS